MLVRLVVVLLACAAASSLAIMIAGASIALFERLLKRVEQEEEKQRP